MSSPPAGCNALQYLHPFTTTPKTRRCSSVGLNLLSSRSASKSHMCLIASRWLKCSHYEELLLQYFLMAYYASALLSVVHEESRLTVSPAIFPAIFVKNSRAAASITTTVSACLLSEGEPSTPFTVPANNLTLVAACHHLFFLKL